MVNPFKAGDKVLAMRQGVEIEAVVRTTWNHEVQVRAKSGELLWRTMKTIRMAPQAEPEVAGEDSQVDDATPEDVQVEEQHGDTAEAPEQYSALPVEPADDGAGESAAETDGVATEEPAEVAPEEPEAIVPKARKRRKARQGKEGRSARRGK